MGSEIESQLLEFFDTLETRVVDLGKFGGFYSAAYKVPVSEVESAFQSLTQQGMLAYDSGRDTYSFLGTTPEEASKRKARAQKTMNYLAEAGIDVSQIKDFL